MTAAWVLYVLLVGSLLACAALSIDGMLRRTALPTRWAWFAALAGILALAALAPREEPAPMRLRVSSAEVTAPQAAAPAAAPLGIGAVLTSVRHAIASPVSRALSVADARIPAGVLLGLGMAWCLLSALVLALLVIVSRRVRLARLDWPLADVHGVPVRIARTVGPAVIGFVRPEIVVPRWLLARSAEEQRLVIVHEGEHVAARDQLLLIGGWTVVALLPWHPAAWWALSRMRLAIELDCDARVLKRGVEPRPYGALLIDIAGQYAGLRVGALALADGTSHLERRLLAMNRSRTRLALVRTALLGAVATLSVAMACEARLPTSAEVDQMNVASIEKTAMKAKLLAESGEEDRAYYVDDAAVTAAEAHAMGTSRIATVNITKNKTPGGKDQVRIYTMRSRMRDTITMKAPVTVTLRGDSSANTIETNKISLASKTAFTGIVLIDGVRSTDKALAALSPNDINTVEIVKGLAAVQEWPDPAAIHGVIKVTTKNGATAARP